VGNDAKVITNHFIRHQKVFTFPSVAPALDIQTYKPLMSNFVFDDSNIGMIFATHHMFPSSLADTNAYLMFTRIN